MKISNIDIYYSRSAAAFQLAALLGCLAIWHFGAPPGVAVACLALAAVVMAFRIVEKDFSKTEQLLWIVFAVAFLKQEIRSISIDRADSAKHDEELRAEDRVKFEAFLSQGRAINAEQRSEEHLMLEKFSGLLGQGERSVVQLGRVSEKVKEASGYASGGSSFPRLFAYELTTGDGKRKLGVSFTKAGSFPLYDVQVSVGRAFSVPNPTPESTIFGITCVIGEVDGNWSTPILADPLRDGSAYYIGYMNARNGYWEEVIDARRVSGEVVTRSVITEYGLRGPKIVFDVHDQNFPSEHLHDKLFPSIDLKLKPVSERLADPSDQIMGLFPNGGHCSKIG